MGREIAVALFALSLGARASSLHENASPTERLSRPIQENQNIDYGLMARLLRISRSGPLVKDLILVCYDVRRDHVGSACRNQAAELRACGINVHVIDNERSADRIARMQAVSRQVSPCTPIIVAGHGGRGLGSEEHHVAAPDSPIRTRDLMGTLRGLYPQSPILLQSCRGGLAISEGHTRNLATSCAGNSVCYNQQWGGLLENQFLPQSQLVLRELFCSRAVFQALSPDGRNVGRRELEQLYLSHPNFYSSEYRSTPVSLERAAETVTAQEAWLAAQRETCPRAGERASFCLGQQPCPLNFTGGVTQEPLFHVEAHFQRQWDESVPAETRQRMHHYESPTVISVGHQRLAVLETSENFPDYAYNPAGPPGNCGMDSRVYLGEALGHHPLWRMGCDFKRTQIVSVAAKATCLSKPGGSIRYDGPEFPVFSNDFRISECR